MGYIHHPFGRELSGRVLTVPTVRREETEKTRASEASQHYRDCFQASLEYSWGVLACTGMTYIKKGQGGRGVFD